MNISGMLCGIGILVKVSVVNVYDFVYHHLREYCI